MEQKKEIKPCLYLVPTPIGNLTDMTPRALSVLSTVDLILAEDTRVSNKLLLHFNIHKSLKSFHSQNEHKSLQAIIDKLKQGLSIAIVTDAGTPGISDP
ncbi:MAG: SAM-dependent methyltransferase, partial [Saprospiraceae bacterium]